MRWGRRAAADESAETEGESQFEFEVSGSPSTGAVANASVLLRWVMWALVGLGPVLGLLALTGSSHPAGLPQQASQGQRKPVIRDGAGPAGFGEMFVAAYLAAGEGDEQALAAYYPAAQGMRLSGEGEVRTEQVAAVRVEEAGEGYWSVTVGVRVAGEEEEAASKLRYFQVPVASAGSGDGAPDRWVAASLPAEVAVPAAGKGRDLDYGPPAPAVEADPITTSLREFFAAYLTGAGELDRYLSPGTSMPPVTPAPYQEARITQIAAQGDGEAETDAGKRSAPADGEKRELLVDVEATAAESGARRPMTYAVSLTARDGRWEVSALKGTPSLAGSPGGDHTTRGEQ